MNGYHFVRREPIQKGWSADRKYCATDKDGMRYFLRISPLEKYESKRSEYKLMQQVAALGIPMCEPRAFGTSDEGVYGVYSWIEGSDAREVIPTLSDSEAYVYGIEAGSLLQRIHSLPAPEHQPEWETRFNNKIDVKVSNYKNCPIQYKGGNAFIEYINRNRHLLKGRQQSVHHGDYHIGNMMIDSSGRLHIIDFDRYDYGDPWEEFNRIVWCAQSSPPFASGMVDGYFDRHVPHDFWRLLALYISTNILSSISWAIPFGQKEIDTMLIQAKDILTWYDDMNRIVPTWYASYNI